MTNLDTDNTPGIGNKVNRIVHDTIGAVFTQGELAQLTHSAFDNAATAVHGSSDETITISYPVGYAPTKQPITSNYTYKKQELLGRYQHLAYTTLPMNGIYQLSMIMETMFGDLIRQLVMEFPEKIGSKRHIVMKDVLQASSLEDIYLKATDTLLNELSYKSPRDFATEAQSILSTNLLECSAYHSYIEMKATRDVLIHNKGIANEAYITKAGSHARTKVGLQLPVTQIYFLECYEACLQLLEWLEVELHRIWHSSEYMQRQKERSKPK